MVFKPLASIIVPCWDGVELTTQFCEAVLDRTPYPLNELIIINNGSTDSTAKYLADKQQEYPSRLCIITNRENQSFARAVNQGFLVAEGEYLVLGHNDIRIGDSQWLGLLLAPLHEYKKRLVGPRYIDWNPLTTVDGKIISYLDGWAWAFHKCFLKDVGYFDERFQGSYYEDVELCWRAQRHGYELYEATGLPITHDYGATCLNGPHHDDLDGIGVPAVSKRNQLLFVEKIRSGDDSPFYPEGLV